MKKLLTCILLCILLCGCVKSENILIYTYDKIVAQMSLETMGLYKKQIQWYNLNLYSVYPDIGFERSFDSVLDIVDGVIGYVEIPGLSVQVPIYHVPHEDGFYLNCYSAFPRGWKGEHSELYTDLPLRMQTGDVFYVHILDEVLSYQIREGRDGCCDLICNGSIYAGTYIVED